MMPRVTGRWQIVEMDLWDPDAIDLLGPAFMEIGADRTGSFRFIAVEGDIDGRHVERDRHPAVVFSWVGVDDNDERPVADGHSSRRRSSLDTRGTVSRLVMTADRR